MFPCLFFFRWGLVMPDEYDAGRFGVQVHRTMGTLNHKVSVFATNRASIEPCTFSNLTAENRHFSLRSERDDIATLISRRPESQLISIDVFLHTTPDGVMEVD